MDDFFTVDPEQEFNYENENFAVSGDTIVFYDTAAGEDELSQEAGSDDTESGNQVAEENTVYNLDDIYNLINDQNTQIENLQSILIDAYQQDQTIYGNLKLVEIVTLGFVVAIFGGLLAKAILNKL